MDREVYIYRIFNLITEKCYIGSTLGLQRLAQHRSWLKHNRHFNRKLQNAWNKYGEEAFKFEIIHTCTETNRNLQEAFYIAKFNSVESGYNLVQIDLDTGKFYHTVETRTLISRLKLGKKLKPLSPERKQKISDSNIGKHKRTLTEEQRLKCKENNKNRVYTSHTEESKMKMREAHRNRKPRSCSEETKRKISEAKTGKHWKKPMSEEHRLAMSLARKGKSKPPRTPEHCKAISDAKRKKKVL